MTAKLMPFWIFTVALFLGTLYAALLGLVAYQLKAALMSWPVWITLFWLLFRKFGLTCLPGYLAVFPLVILSCEVVRTILQPPSYAFQLKSLDRSHYTPRARVQNPNSTENSLGATAAPATELYIGDDGFRADPETGRGNPARCHEVLIGDSMIHGLGLPYRQTLGPLLGKDNLQPCIFGVAGNAPVDYLATLDFVRDRIDDGAHVAIYVYAYNDFVSWNKLLERTTRHFSIRIPQITGLINYYDDWRRTTFVQGFFRAKTKTANSPLQIYRVKMGASKAIQVHWPHDPSQYPTPAPLDRTQRTAFRFFLHQLKAMVASRPWRVTIVFIPDNEEVLANLANSSLGFRDLDSRRLDALKMCISLWPECQDLTRPLVEMTIANGQSPYLLKDRHFSYFGIQVLADHYLTMYDLRRTQSPELPMYGARPKIAWRDNRPSPQG